MASTLMGEMLPCAQVPELVSTWSLECWSGASKTLEITWFCLNPWCFILLKSCVKKRIHTFSSLLQAICIILTSSSTPAIIQIHHSWLITHKSWPSCAFPTREICGIMERTFYSSRFYLSSPRHQAFEALNLGEEVVLTGKYDGAVWPATGANNYETAGSTWLFFPKSHGHVRKFLKIYAENHTNPNGKVSRLI